MAHYALCVSTRAKRRRLRAYAASQNAWRLGYPQVWAIKFRRLPPGGQQWAYSTGACESGNNPATSTGNGFYGAFQWVPSTWASAGGDRPVTSASWHHQATLAWLWHLGHPSGQWPVCGE